MHAKDCGVISPMTYTHPIRHNLRRAMVTVVKPFPPARRRARQIINNYRSRIYRQIKKQTPTESKTIIFESFMGRSYSDSPRAIYLQMLQDERFDSYHFIWALREDRLDDVNAYPELQQAEIIQTGSPEYYRSYARAAIWISNSRLPSYLQPATNQKYIQTWHGTALKRLGYDIQHDGGNAMYTLADLRYKNDLDASRYYALVSPSPFMNKVYSSAFNLAKINPDCQIWETGYPRNDQLTNTSAKEVRTLKKKYNIPLNKKVILYTPTWRDNQHKSGQGYTYKNELDFDQLRQRIGDDYVILFRTHYFVVSQFNFAKYNGFVRNVSDVENINDLYLISDMLVTDYSSTFFDFAILRRPIIFFMFDLANYENNLHGFYLPLANLPGPITKTTKQLADAILNPPSIDRKYRQFIHTYCPHDDGSASRRVVDKIALTSKEDLG